MSVMTFDRAYSFKSSELAEEETSRDMEKRRPHPPKVGCELFSFMHKTLLNPLLNVSQLLRTDFQNLVRKKIKDLSDTLWVENMIKSIRAIDRTNS